MLDFADFTWLSGAHREHKQGEQMSSKKWILPIITVVVAATSNVDAADITLLNVSYDPTREFLPKRVAAMRLEA